MGSDGRADFRLEVGTERVLHIAVDLDLATKESFQTSLASAREGDEAVVLDLSEVRFLDSSGLAVILSAHLDGADVRVRGASPIVRRTFEVAGVTELLSLEG